MRQFYSNRDVPEVDEQRRVTMYMESTFSLTPVRRCSSPSSCCTPSCTATASRSSAAPTAALYNVLLELGNMPDRVSDEQNRRGAAAAAARPRDDFFTSGTGAVSDAPTAIDSLAELRHKLLDCLRDAPTVNLRHGETLTRRMEELLPRVQARVASAEAAATRRPASSSCSSSTGTAADGQGPGFLQEAADEISRRARHRVALAPPRART